MLWIWWFLSLSSFRMHIILASMCQHCFCFLLSLLLSLFPNYLPWRLVCLCVCKCKYEWCIFCSLFPVIHTTLSECMWVASISCLFSWFAVVLFSNGLRFFPLACSRSWLLRHSTIHRTETFFSHSWFWRRKKNPHEMPKPKISADTQKEKNK